MTRCERIVDALEAYLNARHHSIETRRSFLEWKERGTALLSDEERTKTALTLVITEELSSR